MDSCPACTASLIRHGKQHCPSPTCVWVKCMSCKVSIDTSTQTYNKDGKLWGNPDGYLKAAS